MNTHKKTSFTPIAFSAMIAASLAACSSSDSSDPDPGDGGPGASSRMLFVVDEAANQGTVMPRYAVASDNATTQFWTDFSGAVAHASLEEAGTSVGARVDYDVSTGRPVLIEDRATGAYLVIEERNPQRVDFLVYGADDLYQNGYSVFTQGTDYATAPLIGVPAFQGQLAGQLTGTSETGSYAMIAEDEAGLGTPTTLPLDTAALIEALGGASLVTAQDEVIENLAWAGVVLGRSASRGLSASAHGSAGVAMLLTRFEGSDLVSNLAGGFTAATTDAQEILDVTLACIADRRAPSFASAWSFLEEEVLSAELYSNGVVNDAKNDISASGSFDAVGAVDEGSLPGSFPAPSDEPPAISTSLSGQGVFQDGTVYFMTGSVEGDGTISCMGADSGGASMVTIQADLVGSVVTGVFDRDGEMGAVDGNSEPLGECDVNQQSGGQGTFTFAQFIGTGQGVVQFRYEAFTIPDAFTVSTSEGVRFSTNGLVSGEQFIDIPVNNEPIVFVSVSAPQNGTLWNYTLGCIE
ncbi:MAG: hypothetical protein AAGG01_04170 [Planctomycetota bacterium]